MSDISPYGLAYVAVAQHRHFTEAVDASEYAVDIVLVQNTKSSSSAYLS